MTKFYNNFLNHLVAIITRALMELFIISIGNISFRLESFRSRFHLCLWAIVHFLRNRFDLMQWNNRRWWRFSSIFLVWDLVSIENDFSFVCTLSKALFSFRMLSKYSWWDNWQRMKLFRSETFSNSSMIAPRLYQYLVFLLGNWPYFTDCQDRGNSSLQ